MYLVQKNCSVDSRSYSIFTITIKTWKQGSDSVPRVNMMNIVHLAGSEHKSTTGKTLYALRNVISALGRSEPVIQHCNRSNLTRLLQDSFDVDSKTVMCACIGPVDDNYEETLDTLRYANKILTSRTDPNINKDPKDEFYTRDLNRLKENVRHLEDEKTRIRNELQEKLRERENELRESRDLQLDA